MQCSSHIISVAVLTYNSEGTIIETLESVCNQSYHNIELIISDDCSIDNTIEICERWIENHKSRFLRTIIVKSKVNTGTSSNLNRAEKECKGMWVKPIAGDDKLVEDCIESCVRYVEDNKNVKFLFGKCKSFGADDSTCREVDGRFDYNFFSMPKEKQLNQLIFSCNCVPASTFFYNRNEALLMDIRNDERIPLLEDWPKWINLLHKDANFYFLDKVLVLYRIGGVSTSALISIEMFRSERLFYFYYLFPEWSKVDYDAAVKRMVDFEVGVYGTLKEKETMSEAMIRKERDSLRDENNYLKGQITARISSKSYRLGHIILHPFDSFRRFFCKS